MQVVGVSTTDITALQMCTLKDLCPSPSASVWRLTRLLSTVPLAEVIRKLLGPDICMAYLLICPQGSAVREKGL